MTQLKQYGTPDRKILNGTPNINLLMTLKIPHNENLKFNTNKNGTQLNQNRKPSGTHQGKLLNGTPKRKQLRQIDGIQISN